MSPGNIETLNLKRGKDDKMLRILLLAAKKAISRRWRSTLTPTVEEWIDAISRNYVMEKITASIRLEIGKCNNLEDLKTIFKTAQTRLGLRHVNCWKVKVILWRY